MASPDKRCPAIGMFKEAENSKVIPSLAPLSRASFLFIFQSMGASPYLLAAINRSVVNLIRCFCALSLSRCSGLTWNCLESSLAHSFRNSCIVYFFLCNFYPRCRYRRCQNHFRWAELAVDLLAGGGRHIRYPTLISVNIKHGN